MKLNGSHDVMSAKIHSAPRIFLISQEVEKRTYKRTKEVFFEISAFFHDNSRQLQISYLI